MRKMKNSFNEEYNAVGVFSDVFCKQFGEYDKGDPCQESPEQWHAQVAVASELFEEQCQTLMDHIATELMNGIYYEKPRGKVATTHDKPCDKVIIKPAELFATPSSSEELVERINMFTGEERMVAFMVMNLTWNLCSKLVRESQEGGK
jgi:hypothetical protein